MATESQPVAPLNEADKVAFQQPVTPIQAVELDESQVHLVTECSLYTFSHYVTDRLFFPNVRV